MNDSVLICDINCNNSSFFIYRHVKLQRDNMSLVLVTEVKKYF